MQQDSKQTIRLERVGREWLSKADHHRVRTHKKYKPILTHYCQVVRQRARLPALRVPHHDDIQAKGCGAGESGTLKIRNAFV